jgi:ubiquinone/menaquinone biosynthesis C-methylase UbiE
VIKLIGGYMTLQRLAEFFDAKAKERDRWINKNWYYNRKIADLMKFHIPPGRAVLEIGCGTGVLLNSLFPGRGVGIDFSREMIKIASKKYPHLRFINADVADYKLNERFDYIVISDTIGYFEDIQKALRNIRQNCTNKTRIIITSYNYLWEPVFKFAEILGLKMKQPLTNWLLSKDIEGLLHLEDFNVVKVGENILMPIYIPLVTSLFNKYISKLPIIQKLCLIQYIIARPINIEPRKERSVSIIVAARNEEGNIEEIVKNIPALGTKTEIVFVEGHSKDNTWEEIKRVVKKYKERNIKFAKQDGEGKGDAIRKGFEMATGDILMVYDADRTVPEKDLVKFYEAIVSNRGEFINGSRLVYPLKKESMRMLNLLGNKFFSMMFTWLLEQRIKDTLCGTKVISKENYGILKKNREYFGDFDPFGDFDLILGADKLDLKIAELPIRYQERKYGSTNIKRFAHGWLLLKMCIFTMRKIKFI